MNWTIQCSNKIWTWRVAFAQTIRLQHQPISQTPRSRFPATLEYSVRLSEESRSRSLLHTVLLGISLLKVIFLSVVKTVWASSRIKSTLTIWWRIPIATTAKVVDLPTMFVLMLIWPNRKRIGYYCHRPSLITCLWIPSCREIPIARWTLVTTLRATHIVFVGSNHRKQKRTLPYYRKIQERACLGRATS